RARRERRRIVDRGFAGADAAPVVRAPDGAIQLLIARLRLIPLRHAPAVRPVCSASILRVAAEMLGLALAGHAACGAHDMTSLMRLEPVTLGVAAAGSEGWCTLAHIDGRWSVAWPGTD